LFNKVRNKTRRMMWGQTNEPLNRPFRCGKEHEYSQSRQHWDSTQGPHEHWWGAIQRTRLSQSPNSATQCIESKLWCNVTYALYYCLMTAVTFSTKLRDETFTFLFQALIITPPPSTNLLTAIYVTPTTKLTSSAQTRR
jgi:hypothetical protein